MNKQQAAKELKISVRSLQRLVQNKVLTVIYKRGNSGKQEAVFDADEVARYKTERDRPTNKLVRLPINDKNTLARNATLELLEIFRNSPAKTVVPVADKILLTVQDCRLLTGLSEQTIRDSIRDETLKARVIGRGYKIKRSDLNEFVTNL
jgi:excisionase family DNA binding protein